MSIHVKDWQLRKCDTKGCVLNIWHKSSSHCIFHDPEPDKYTYNALSRVIQYLNSSAINPYGPIGDAERPDLLLIERISISRRISDNLKRGLKRQVVFSDCSFEDPSFLNECEFNEFIEFDRCNLFPHGNDPIVYKCKFYGGLRIRTEIDTFIFRECRFQKLFDIGFMDKAGRLTKSKKQRCNIESCVFEPSLEATYLLSNSKLKILQCSFHTLVSISNCTKGNHPLYIEKSRFNDYASIMACDHEEVSFKEVMVVKDFLIRGYIISATAESNSYQRLSCPQLTIEGMDRFGSPKIIFRNINLSDFNVKYSDFVFHNIEMDNVEYEHLGGLIEYRFGFHAEKKSIKDLRIHRADSQRGQALFIKIRECYKNLKIYYDSKGDYGGGNNFHVGELWAHWQGKRLEWGFFKRNFSWYRAYWIISKFGQSWLRPLQWIIASFFIALVIYIEFNISNTPTFSGPVIKYFDQFDGFQRACQNILIWYKPFGAVSMHSKYLIVEIVSIAQYSITLIAGLFFILALRRRFKR